MVIEVPARTDGAAMWRIARDSGSLDLNSPYAYVLWGRDFAATSVVARIGDRVGGFITGYLRPEAPEVLMVWQVAVDAEHRGQGLAGRMLATLVDRAIALGARFVETTITADNAASIRLFTGLARDRDTTIERSDLFAAELLGDGHAAEDLYRIGPFGTVGSTL
ncbi:diaminobutyrate acetyltransferase [Actinoalloteichus hymeniacidonis]|uniref:L-2,4-diaminobutyric acid acetyltransferase n=1 Tax=Actinoalloteichus hymeniacidonis TaxID=340345 RepID=A0AAC9HLX6_9PSEU|nr:diaminobutyrate acetyltransferase [Actinoalloteichus hymeniacidonis]